MLALILGQHPEIFSFHELHFFEELWDPVKAENPLKDKEAINLFARLITIQRDGYFTQRSLSSYAKEAEKILAQQTNSLTPPSLFAAFLNYEAQRHNKTIACDQTPRNVFYLKEVLSLFPEAYAINIVRDPRDIILSQKGKWRRRYLGMSDIPRKEMIRAWSNYHPITISMLWNSSINAAKNFKNHPRVFHVRFEDLVSDPEKWIKQLCDLIEVEYKPEMLLVPQTGSSHKMDEPQAKGIDPSVAQRWKRQKQHQNDLFICQKITKSNMQTHNYAQASLQKNWLVILWIILLWPIKSILAFILNIRRVKNLTSTLKKRFSM